MSNMIFNNNDNAKTYGQKYAYLSQDFRIHIAHRRCMNLREVAASVNTGISSTHDGTKNVHRTRILQTTTPSANMTRPSSVECL